MHGLWSEAIWYWLCHGNNGSHANHSGTPPRMPSMHFQSGGSSSKRGLANGWGSRVEFWNCEVSMSMGTMRSQRNILTWTGNSSDKRNDKHANHKRNREREGGGGRGGGNEWRDWIGLWKTGIWKNEKRWKREEEGVRWWMGGCRDGAAL